MKHPILTLFGFNLEDIPDPTFASVASEVSTDGNFLINYRKQFRDEVFEIFELIEIKNIGGSCNNIFFASNNLDKISYSKVENLLNKLSSIYGPDDQGRGKVNNEDRDLFNDKEFCMLFGRSWAGIENKVEYPCAVGIDKEANSINLTIWGIGLDQGQN